MKRPNKQELLAYYAVGKPILMLGDKESEIYYFTNKHTRTSLNTEILHISTHAHICDYINLDEDICTKCLWLRINYFDGHCVIPENEEEVTMLVLGMSYDKTN